MCPDQIEAQRLRHPRRLATAAQRGFSIVSSIFLLVVLATLGAFMVTFSTVQHTTSAMDVRGAQAYQAARAGIEWGTYKVLRPPTSCISSQLLNDVANFVVTVACEVSGTYKEGTTDITMYRITSTASAGTVGSIGYVERQLQATVSSH